MGLQYPHLTQATRFPDVTQAKPYAQYHNDFDYTRWTPGTKITVCNVPWDDTRNIVAWEDEASRNAWFDGLSAHRETLNSEFHVLPDGTLKLPIPFATMSRYNYVWVEYPMPTSSTEPLEYAKEPRARHWGFFMDSPAQLAANTTECHLRLDNWGTFGLWARFNYCQLRRGHAPLAAIDADTYLSNPIEHAGMLLTPDVNYGPDAAITRDHTFIPWDSETKLVMFATTVSVEGFRTAGETKPWASAPTDPTYSDNPARWGHQYEVNGYAWNMGDSDMRDLTTPTDTYTSTDGVIPNGVHVYAVDSSQAKRLFEALVKRMPQIMQTIKGVWIVPSTLPSMGDALTVDGITFHACNGVNDMPDIQLALDKSRFHYPVRYANLAKLYTFPYAALELSDNDGTSAVIRIENTGTLTLHRRVSLAYPYLKAQAFLTGVNGTGARTYEWRDLNGVSHDGVSYDTDFTEFMCSYDIPVYGLYISGETDWSLHNQLTNIDAERLKALNTYHTGMRSTNTGYENTKDSANTSYSNAVRSANTGLSNATASADTGQTVTNDAADTAYQNTLRSNKTARQNAGASNATAKSNADAGANTALTNANASAATGRDNANASAYAGEQNAFASNATAQNNTNASADNTLANQRNTNDTNSTNTEATNQTALDDRDSNKNQVSENMNQSNALSTNNMNADIDLGNLQANLEKVDAAINAASSALSAFTPGGGGAGAAIGAIVGGGWAIAKNEMVRSATVANMATKNSNGVTFTQETSATTKRNMDSITRHGNDLRTTTTDNSNTLALTNTTNDVNTTKNNATRQRSTDDANATRSYNAAIANATRSYDTSVGNNANTNATALANNKRTYDTAEANADRNKTTGDANAKDSNDVAHRNSKRSRDTAVSNATATKDTTGSNADATLKVTSGNALESREAAEFTHKTMLEQAEEVTRLSYAQARNNAPVMHGEYKGNPTPDMFAYRGVQVRVKTQSESAIRQAGDQFLRYGYQYEGNWDVTTLNIMPKFTYWEMNELWLDVDTDIMMEAKQAIKDMFENGVTVWHNPNDIGKVGIHDNHE